MRIYKVLWVVLLLMLLPTAAKAQDDYGKRLQGANGWLLPVPTSILGSDEDDHAAPGRNSPSLAWDLVAPAGSAVYAMAPGRVSYAGCNNAGGYGCWVLLNHAGGYDSAYGHCATGSIRVRAGQTVDANTLLCQVGWTGKTSFGPHTHFEIRRGGFQRVGRFFDGSQMRRCFLCNVQGAPVAVQGITAKQTATPTAQNALQRIVATMTAEQFATLVTALVTGIMLAWWLFGLWVRVVIVATTTTATVATIFVLMLMPAMPVQAGQQSAVAGGGGDWEKAYQIVQGNEGWKCTDDGAYTMGGVTQGTYNRWRRLHGMGSADVCANLTREQAKQVFYDLFWVQSGADKMPFNLALTVVDHYYNTGTVSHLLAQCGTDVACFNQARINHYRSMTRMCNTVINSRGDTYCTAWINRVNKIRKYTGG